MPDEQTIIDPAILDRIDGLTAMAERNGWNAAINACRQHLPPEYSILLRGLYKLNPTST